ncbi:hypothetical protein [Streptomyces sp. NPDC059076]|uniref:hypothetical protein n=1 Tax=unclassified Streptomyces TaxID=2593676 RepID=UPI003682CD10
MTSNEQFIADQMRQAVEARNAGNNQAMGDAIINALSESTGPVTERLRQMTEAVNQQNNR